MSLAAGILTLLGVGFLAANVRLVLEYFRFIRRRRAALLTWPGPTPPYYGTKLAIGVSGGTSPQDGQCAQAGAAALK